MCGIIGYVGDKEAFPVLVEGLKRLEYRGYDSMGFSVKGIEGDLITFKQKGKISEFKDKNIGDEFNSKIGIAHTRWATHGKPNKINAHPHTDCKNQIAIVHNGIIENFESLKKILKKEGHNIVSDTDSEILAHMIERFYESNKDFEKSVLKTLELIEGTFGLAVLHKNEGEIIAARHGSPLILGICKNGIIVSSDAAPILKHTKNAIYLKDNEIAIFNGKKYCVKNINGDLIDKEIEEIKWNVEQVEKKGFKHFMQKEIFEQPESLRNVIRGRIKSGRIKLSVDIGDLEKLNRIIITACGTSWHSALIGKYLIEKLVKIPVEVDYASEFRYKNPVLNENDLFIAVSQSGETADTLAALREAKSKGVKTLGIVNVVGSTISREVDSGIYLHAGPEIGVASTKAFTSQVLSLLMFALYMKQEKNILLDKNLLEEMKNLPEKVKEVLKYSSEIRKIVGNFKDSKNFLYLGRGINFPVSLEGALKLKEISYIHAEGYPAAEMKHGPIALIDENIPVVFIASKGRVFEKVLSNMQEVKSRGGIIVTVTDSENSTICDLSDYVLKVPECPEEIHPLINSIPLQLLAYHLADLKGLDVDKPRNLAKSVTVE